MQQPETTHSFLTTGRAAEILLIHPKTLEKWRAQGRGPRFLRLCGRVRYIRSDVESFIATSVVDPAKEAANRNRARRRQHQRAA